MGAPEKSVPTATEKVASISIFPISQPQSWWYFLGSFSALAAVGVLIAALFVQYQDNRPINLEFHTNYLANELRSALMHQYIPDESISAAPRQRRRNREATWNFHRLDVDVPPKIKLEGIKQLVEAAMLDRYVTVAEAPAEAGRAVLSFSYGDLEFARLALKPALPTAALLQDLRPECAELVRNLQRLLEQVGIDPEALRLGEVEEHQDAEYLWNLTRIQVQLDAEITPGELKGRLEEELAVRDLRVYTAASGGGKTTLRIAMRNRDCLRLECLLPGAPPPQPVSPQETKPLAEAPAAAAESAPEISYPADTAAPAKTVPPPSPSAPPAPVTAATAAPPEEKPEKEPPTPPGPRDQNPPVKIAIILDDGGYGGKITERVLALDPRLTLSILPDTPFGKDTAEAAVKKGFEVMLHMPMESASKTVRPFPNQLTTAMKKEEIQRLTRLALAETPGATGVNNHTGGLFTEDTTAVSAFLEVLKAEKLFFVDSLTSPDSVAYKTAKALGLSCGERDVFLDNDKNDPDKIAAQLDELLRLARKHGQAIGIGHFSLHTVDVLEKQLPNLKKENVTLSHVSALL